MNIGMEEGDTCGRDGCEGTIRLVPTENCSCHINPPCSGCENSEFECDKCHEIVGYTE